MSLLVVGSVAYDSVETPYGHRDDALGGSATFFCLAASHFVKPSLVAVVGEDFEHRDIQTLQKAGVDISGLERSPGKTFRWGGKYSADMNHRETLFTHLNVFESFKPKLAAAQQDAQLVFLANIQPSLQLGVLSQVGCPRFVAADTMNLWIGGARDELVEVLSHVDALFLNDSEALELTGCRTMVAAASEIQAMGPDLVIIKRGEHGALVFNTDDVFYVPAYPLEKVIDPTGAGDTFAGGFMGYLASTGDFSPSSVRRAAVVGSLMASFCVEGFSVDAVEHIDQDAIRRRFAEFRALTAFEDLDL